MANCIIETFRCLWSFIQGSLRLILFFGCLMLAIVQLGMLMVVASGYSPPSQLPMDQPNSSQAVLVLLLMFIVSLLGCYGSFFKHRPAIKAFVYMNCIFFGAMVFDVAFNYNSFKNLDSRIDEMFIKMRGYMDNYNWDSSMATNNETISWDIMQQFLCCGIDGPKDWNKYRPENQPENSYPRSCCSIKDQFRNNNYGLVCMEQVWKTGCRERFEQVAAFSSFVSFLFFVFQTFLFFLGLAILSPDSCCRSQPTTTSAILVEGGNQMRQNHQQLDQCRYQKLDQSVYVRQSPYNPATGDIKGGHKSIYPELNRSESYSNPPPSYGTGA